MFAKFLDAIGRIIQRIAILKEGLSRVFECISILVRAVIFMFSALPGQFQDTRHAATRKAPFSVKLGFWLLCTSLLKERISLERKPKGQF